MSWAHAPGLAAHPPMRTLAITIVLFNVLMSLVLAVRVALTSLATRSLPCRRTAA